MYTATHKLSGDIRAVKIVDKTMVNQRDEQRLFQEFAILKQLVTSSDSG